MASTAKVHVNVLPCSIAHNGPVKAVEPNWKPETAPGGAVAIEGGAVMTAYHHGRRLLGEAILLDKEYQGLVARSRPVPTTVLPLEADEAADEVEGRKKLVQVASFEAVTNWAHEAVPDKSDIFAMGLKEWISFAKAVHE